MFSLLMKNICIIDEKLAKKEEKKTQCECMVVDLIRILIHLYTFSANINQREKIIELIAHSDSFLNCQFSIYETILLIIIVLIIHK